MRSELQPALAIHRHAPLKRGSTAPLNGPTERAVARWTLKHLRTLRHELHVLALADALFTLLRPVHGLGASGRRLLRLAALVHDVGRGIDDKRHPQIGARLLRMDRSAPLSASQRRRLAYLTRYHRGAVPEAGYDDILRPDDPHRELRTILAILRAADALDGRQHHPPIIQLKLRDQRRLKVRVDLIDDTRRARRFFSRRKKFRMLADVLGLEIATTLRSATVPA